MALKCVAIDDEPLALELIKTYVTKLPDCQLLRSFDDAISGSEFLRHNAVDLLFLDINMPDINGIEMLSSLEEKPLTIFTTAYKNFAYEGFQLEAVDYLLKPFSFDRFAKAVSKAQDQVRYKAAAAPSPDDFIFVRSEYKMVKIMINDIEYIEGLEDYIKIHLLNARPILTLMTLKSILDKLPATKFMRIHRSYIVALPMVVSMVNKKISLSSGKELPVSDSYIADINKWINP